MTAAWFAFGFHWVVVVPLAFAVVATLSLVGLTIERWFRAGSWCQVDTPSDPDDFPPWLMDERMTLSRPDLFEHDAQAFKLMMLGTFRPLPPKTLLVGWTNSA